MKPTNLSLDFETVQRLRDLSRYHETSMSATIRLIVREAHRNAVKVKTHVTPFDRMPKRKVAAK